MILYNTNLYDQSETGNVAGPPWRHQTAAFRTQDVADLRYTAVTSFPVMNVANPDRTHQTAAFRTQDVAGLRYTAVTSFPVMNVANSDHRHATVTSRRAMFNWTSPHHDKIQVSKWWCGSVECCAVGQSIRRYRTRYFSYSPVGRGKYLGQVSNCLLHLQSDYPDGCISWWYKYYYSTSIAQTKVNSAEKGERSY